MTNHMTLALCSWPSWPLKSSLLSGSRVDLVCVFRCDTSFPVPTWTPHGNLAILGAMLGTIGNETVNPRVFAWTRLARWLTDASARHPPQLIIRCLCLRNPRREAERYGLSCQARYTDRFEVLQKYITCLAQKQTRMQQRRNFKVQTIPTHSSTKQVKSIWKTKKTIRRQPKHVTLTRWWKSKQISKRTSLNDVCACLSDVCAKTAGGEMVVQIETIVACRTIPFLLARSYHQHYSLSWTD